MIIWTIYLLAALYVLLKGADVVIDSSRRIGLAFGLSPFIVGLVIVGFGTSLPELASSLAGLFQGAPEIVIANVVGSNITNILLIVGLMATLGGTIVIKRNLLQGELPIFFISTVHFAAVVYDGVIDRVESLLLLGTFCAYMWYVYSESKTDPDGNRSSSKPPFKAKDFIIFVFGLGALLVGANYTVEMAVNLATAFEVPLGLISIVAIAIGTSLPELIVSMKAIKTGEADLAIGNIFGSNAFNILVVAGLPALLSPIPLIADEVVMQVGLAILLAASAIFFVTGLSRRVMRWEGFMMLIFFTFFLIKLAELI